MVCFAFACLLACVKGHFASLFSSLFLGNFACGVFKPVLFFFSVPMSSRQTNNSRSVSLFSETSQVSVSAGADASSHSSTASTSSPAAATFPATNVPDPAFLAAVVNAVKVTLAAEKTPPSSDGATVQVCFAFACLLACVKGHFASLFSSLFLGNFACGVFKPVFFRSDAISSDEQQSFCFPV